MHTEACKHTHAHALMFLNNKAPVNKWKNNHPCVSNISIAKHLMDDPIFNHLCTLPNDMSKLTNMSLGSQNTQLISNTYCNSIYIFAAGKA